MRLYVTDNPDIVNTSELWVLTPEQFSRVQYHPFIAANKWERIDIDITDKLQTGIIRQIISHVIITPHVDFDNFTTKAMLILCEIFTDDSPKIKSLYQRDKKECFEFIKSLGGTSL